MGMAGHGCIASSISLIVRTPASRWAVGLRHCSNSLRREQPRGFSTCRPAADSRKIDPPDVRQLAKMAHISVTDEEVKEWEPQLAKIVDWFAQLQAVDVEGVPPALRADLSDENVTRPDEVVQYTDREGLLREVPEMQGEFVKVPKIL